MKFPGFPDFPLGRVSLSGHGAETEHHVNQCDAVESAAPALAVQRNELY